MKNILIIYPHWPPSNLAGVHRARLISNYLPKFGWHPIVLAVHSKYYDEKPDPVIEKTVRDTTEVIHVDAAEKNEKKSFISDLALRAFQQIKNKALELIHTREIDFVWIPIPSFYTAVIGRQLYNKTRIPYGIDYIDPWVNSFVGQDKIFSKAWLSNQLSKVLEPYSVKKAALISGVSTSYYEAVLQRNFKNKDVVHVGMPYGFDPLDHDVRLEDIEYPWGNYGIDVSPYIYAGAFLPKSHLFLKSLFHSIRELKNKGDWDEKRKLFFIGTGNYPGKSITEYAKEYGLSETVIEINERFPFLYILNFLNAAAGVIVLGSTEEHYTASKIFQSLLSKKPVFAIFHYKSSAVEIMQNVNGDNFLVKYLPDRPETLQKEVNNKFKGFIENRGWAPNLEKLEPYSAKASAKVLVDALDKIK